MYTFRPLFPLIIAIGSQLGRVVKCLRFDPFRDWLEMNSVFDDVHSTMIYSPVALIYQ